MVEGTLGAAECGHFREWSCKATLTRAGSSEHISVCFWEAHSLGGIARKRSNTARPPSNIVIQISLGAIL
jgi:hypothetical protein